MHAPVADPPVAATGAEDVQALFPEARRHQRRRRAIIALLAVAVTGAAVALAVIASPGGHPRALGHRAAVAPALPLGPVASLGVAGAMAVGPDGALYVADLAGHRVLRLTDGRLRVVAGDGRGGFAGDGGPAARAELSNVSELAFGPGGALYIADGRRVRVVDRAGVIRTVIGPLALRDRALWIAFSPSEQLYVSTGSRILRWRAGRGIETVASGAPDGFGPIAVDRAGNVDVGGLARGWSIWQLVPGATPREIGYARRSGGEDPILQTGPGDVVYGESGPYLLRVGPRGLIRKFTFSSRVSGQYFPLTYFAFGPGGTLYADDVPGNQGFEAHQQILSVSDGRVRLLWEER